MIPADEIIIWIVSDRFDIEVLKQRIQNKAGYRLEVSTVEEEDGGGESITVSYKEHEFYTIIGNFKTSQIREIVSGAKQTFSPSGVKVGDDLVAKVGKRLKCSLEGLSDYCQDPDIPNIVYYVMFGDNCDRPEARQEFDGDSSLMQYELPNCVTVESIGLLRPNS